MIRTATLALVAAALATSAGAQTIRVSTVGKSDAQVLAEVTKAARQVCADNGPGVNSPLELQRVCVKNVVRAAFEQAALARPTALAQR